MANVPLPGTQLTTLEDAIPRPVHGLLGVLWDAGHAAYVVGGSLRDAALGRPAADWDFATDARPERLLEVFPGSVYENQFGTVGVRQDGDSYEITTFRSDHDYADFRRPHRIEFGDTIELDLARRDFTVNAMAWGARAGDPPGLVDPYAGMADVARHVLRAVGKPSARFEEDALRMVRAVRLAASLEFAIEPATLAAIRQHAGLVVHLSGERIASELDRLLTIARPSAGLGLLRETGLLSWISTDLAAQRGIPQNKVAGEDLWDHTLRTVDAAPADRPIVRLAALLHDIGKPATFSEGHFLGHDAVGAELAGAFLERLHAARAVRERVVALVRHHMFSYEPNWSDAAVRRFILKINELGSGALDELLALREADNSGSGLPAGAGRLEELRRRIAAQLAAEVVLDRRGLAIDGGDLITELGLDEGPLLGRILDDLLERVINDPGLNERPTLLLLAQATLADRGMIELLIEAENALSLGMLDRAELLYRQVAGADPRNSIAVVGLARVILERGDESGALKHARRALAIDPENSAAQRMTQRLEEVLRYRETEVAAAPQLPEPAVLTAPPAAQALEMPVEPMPPGGQAFEGPAGRTPPAGSTPPEAAAPSPPKSTHESEPHSESIPQPPPSKRRSVVDRLLRRR